MMIKAMITFQTQKQMLISKVSKARRTTLMEKKTQKRIRLKMEMKIRKKRRRRHLIQKTKIKIRAKKVRRGSMI